MNNKYTKEILEPIVQSSVSVQEVLRKLGVKMAGGTHSHISRRIKSFGIDTSHFLGVRANCGDKHRGGPDKKTSEQVLILKDKLSAREKTFRLKRSLMALGVPHICNECGICPIWNNKPLTLHIDHINGWTYDNRKENLRFLCPNCHAQTETYNRSKKKD